MKCEVDDCLIEGSCEEEAIEKFVMFLDRCRKYNIKISRRKIQCGPVVNFARMTLGGKMGFDPTNKNPMLSKTCLHPPARKKSAPSSECVIASGIFYLISVKD